MGGGHSGKYCDTIKIGNEVKIHSSLHYES